MAHGAPESDLKQTALPLWKRALFSAALGLFVLTVFEITSVVYLKATRGYDGEHLLQYVFDPYKNISPTPNFVDTRGIKHNAQGFRRSQDVSISKPGGTYRIFLMGGSTAYGLGGLWPHLQREFAVIDNSETIDAYLERYLSEAFPEMRFEVINAAITSTWTHHHLIYLNQRILHYDPDVIIFLDGFNDYYQFFPNHDQFDSYAYREAAQTIMGPPTIRSLFFQTGWWFYRKSAFVYLTARALRNVKGALDRPNREPMNVPLALEGLREVFPVNAETMIKRNVMLTRAAGVAPIVVQQPMLILERDRRGMVGIERELFEFNVESWVSGYETYIKEAVEYVRGRLLTAVTELGGVLLDATEIYGDVEGQMYTDYAHLTPRGNEILAGFIGQQIVPLIQSQPAAPTGK